MKRVIGILRLLLTYRGKTSLLNLILKERELTEAHHALTTATAAIASPT